jgi:predicted Na+-dependent transporter
VVLTWISAVIAIVSGVLLLIFAPAVRVQVGNSNVSTAVIIIGVVILVIGLLTAWVATRLGKGGNGARILLTILEGLQIAGALATLSTVSGSNTVSQSVVTIIIGVVILALLWNSRANAFFAR